MPAAGEGGDALEALVGSGGFRFGRLSIEGIDNSRAAGFFGPGILEQETCLLHEAVPGDGYVELLHERLSSGMRDRTPFPVVRFADGEYAFYDGSLRCNGLYRQAESAAAIRDALPAHVADLRHVAETGLLAPLVFPGNVFRPARRFPFFRKPPGDDSAARFLAFLSRHGIRLSRANYVPFYAVYAYLTSRRFARAVDGRTVCVLNSDVDRAACARWFEALSSRPRIAEVRIPAAYVATRWRSMEDEVLARVPEETELFLVGAGVGALPVCAALSRRFPAPAVDAGHALNMMNGMEDKSAGPRLYTVHG